MAAPKVLVEFEATHEQLENLAVFLVTLDAPQMSEAQIEAVKLLLSAVAAAQTEIERPKARVCAGCGAPGTEDEDAAPGQVALHWKVRGVMVCIDCHAKERGKGSQVEGADQDRALAQIVGLLRAARVLSVKGSQLCEVLEEGLGVARAALETPPRYRR